ncbi:hypothetical protein C5Y96_13030 [Blastopirellula marina]|uniref:Uncharacterized protein n=1 Tax=Blastopirellula marina TaxID=124 RepID=A0A2S8FGH2_9BACT|nr:MULTISPECIES: hypothetical protein [Pirellulaceae]PQO31262.1 hypothetical protein C5Y96_13030 [Blastopirellula marina]RCS51656.1 hypothetical protein DTL36_13040 [Bremerella cremea]
MASSSKSTTYLMAGVIAALALWGIYLAIGSYLGLAEGTRGYDIRRGVIVFACMAGFLMFWGVLLWNRQRRLRSDDD